MEMTKSQQQAIDSTAPAILVVAGAGSGKTRVIVNRIARLVKSGVSAQSILVLTFTRKAANELKDRLQKLIGDDAKKIWAGTFHAISYRILSKWGEKIGYKTTGGEKISVVTPEESEFMLDIVKKEYSYTGRKKDILDAKSTLAHDGEFPEDRDLLRVIQEYWNRLKECNALDYDQLLLEVHRLFREAPEALNFYQNKFEHIFVDEYQDTDMIQFNLHEILSPKNLFCVGDPDQNIYSWRGANVSIILGFETAHPGAEVIKLEECFRCGTPIVKAANKLIEHNTNRIEKKLIPTIPEGEAKYIVGDMHKIAEYLSEDCAFEEPGEIAVIGRNHATLNWLKDECEAWHLEVHKVGETLDAISNSEPFKIFNCVLRMALNRHDSIAFWSWGAKWTKIDTENMAKVRSAAIRAGKSMVLAYHDLYPENDLLSLEKTARDKNLSIELIFEKFKSFNRLEPSGELKTLELFLSNYVDFNAYEWLDWCSGKDMHSELESTERDKITLITAHAAKGLEWDIVLILDFSQDIFPSFHSKSNPKLVEEERRLAYVAFTRARKNLRVYSDENHKPSQFIKEAGL